MSYQGHVLMENRSGLVVGAVVASARIAANAPRTILRPADKKKAPTISRKGLIHLDSMAPRPGLEPGTYGLTEALT